MIYEEPRFTPGGDRFIEMELGDELNFDLNFLVHALTARVREADFDGIIELLPNMASIVISYDPDRIGYDDVVREISALFASLGSLEDVELPSPLYTFPVLYFDHVTRACWEDYCARIVEKEYDPDLMVRLNGLESRAQLARIHSGTEYWVAALGFYPGLASLISLDPRCRLTAPKYNPPRTFSRSPRSAQARRRVVASRRRNITRPAPGRPRERWVTAARLPASIRPVPPAATRSSATRRCRCSTWSSAYALFAIASLCSGPATGCASCPWAVRNTTM